LHEHATALKQTKLISVTNGVLLQRLDFAVKEKPTTIFEVDVYRISAFRQEIV